MKDGDIDYSGYTPRELQEALEGINPKAFPKNYENLKVAYRLKFPNAPIISNETIKANEKEIAKKSKKATWNFYYQSQVIFGSLIASCAFLSNPNSYLYALVCIPVALQAYFGFKNPKSKVIFLQSILGLSLYSFIIGRLFFENDRLTNTGLIAIFIAFGAAITLYLVIRQYEYEAAT